VEEFNGVKDVPKVSRYVRKTMNERLYLLKIRLVEIEPEIWRRFVADFRRV
jgi:hypothetical protein